MRMVDPNGEIKIVNKDTPDWKRYIHSFGLAGVIVEMTMKIEPEYAVLKCIYEDLSWDFFQDTKQYKEIMLHALHTAMHRLKIERSVSKSTQISILDPGAVPRKSQLRRLDYKIAICTSCLITIERA